MLRGWLKGWRKYGICACVALASATGSSRGDDAADLRKLIEEQNKQIQELKQRLDNAATIPVKADAQGQLDENSVRKIAKEALAEQEQEKKDAADAKRKQQEEEGIRVGSDMMDVKPYFKDGASLWFTTPSGDFTFHPGMWLNYDNVFWNQSPDLRTPPGARSGHAQDVASGPALGGIGDEQDGTSFRRMRITLEGTAWENMEYRVYIGNEVAQFGAVGLDEVWGAINGIPLLGQVRIGHIKNLWGIEADAASSSREFTFMERGAWSQGIELGQNFFTGIDFNNWFLNERATYAVGVGRTDISGNTGILYGDGQWMAQARLTCLPIYEANGRQLLHLGVSAGYRQGTNNINGVNGGTATSVRSFTLSALPELRDDDPANNSAGSQVTPNANSNSLISTGAIAADHAIIPAVELLYVRGPFSVQADYGWTYLNNVRGIAPTGGVPGHPAVVYNPAIVPDQNDVFSGGYVQVSYILTGESRGPDYDKRQGGMGRYYLGTDGPFHPFYLVRGENGNVESGWGAWEIAARYSYVNLNDGQGLDRIQGGVMNGTSVALNWFLNLNMELQFDIAYDQRSDVPTGVIPGQTTGFGMRLFIEF